MLEFAMVSDLPLMSVERAIFANLPMARPRPRRVGAPDPAKVKIVQSTFGTFRG